MYNKKAYCPICGSLIGYIGWFFEYLFGIGSMHYCGREWVDDFEEEIDMREKYDEALLSVAEAARKYREAWHNLVKNPSTDDSLSLQVADLGRDVDRALAALDQVKDEPDEPEELPRGPNKSTELPRGPHV